MTTQVRTRHFKATAGTDWSPAVEEISTVTVGVGSPDEPESSFMRSRECAQQVLRSIHHDGFVGAYVQLEASAGGAVMSVGSVAASARGGSLQLAMDAIVPFANLWGLKPSPPPWTGQSHDSANRTGESIRFRRLPGLDVDWSGHRWSWNSIVDTIASEEEGSRMRISFLSTSDNDSATRAAKGPVQPLAKLWSTDLTMVAPHELSAFAFGRLTTNLLRLPSWQAIEHLDTIADVDAVELGIPVIGGSRRRFPGDAFTEVIVSDLLGSPTSAAAPRRDAA